MLARPNNDTLYITCMLDLRKDPAIIDIPVIDSKYVSLIGVAYDHYINVLLSTRKGDFKKPEKVLFYSARTAGYKGEKVKGIDRIFEMNGDFVIAAFRVMPHANEPEKFKQIKGEMQSVKMMTLSEFKGGKAKPIDDVEFPSYGKTDADVYGNNLLEVMQFIFNHLSFDPKNKMDQAVLAAFKPLGIEPGKVYDASKVAKIDGERFRKMSQQVQAENLALLTDTEKVLKIAPRMLNPKGKTDLEAIVMVSVIGPLGLPLKEAAYPSVTTTDGKPLNALNDYVIRMSKKQMPPAKAFWSLTLYDSQNGFFIPNDRKKYSVGENSGMKLNADGGIEIYIAAEKPEGVPEENWLPINRKDENMDAILRIYGPALLRLKFFWEVPKAQMLEKK